MDRATVDKELAKNADKEVNVHFVGLNASAATIASLGTAHISIDAGAMFLVHQCSMAFFAWDSPNHNFWKDAIIKRKQMRLFGYLFEGNISQNM